eukprot:TRINITY_DN175_c0_g1_i2.p1 TRINITY_DN175_c0_g1~~TRINITY_DN175_c0_g1_i2.p1  ORF type:complete len:263 (+),score=27.96 TRINITY_DN175_c0_g1_i2:275-1063(+)
MPPELTEGRGDAATRQARITELIRFWYREFMKRAALRTSRQALVSSFIPMMEALTAADFGIPVPESIADGTEEILSEFPDNPPSKLEYLHVFHCSEFSVGIFFVPKGHEIPFHDHPSMTVASRLLYGTLHNLSLDWVEEPKTIYDDDGSSRASGYAKIVENCLAPEVSSLEPEHGNIHRLRALTSCAFLDILSPPYDARYNRECKYYKVVDDGRVVGDIGDVVMLQQIPEPAEYECKPSPLPVPHNIPSQVLVHTQKEPLDS